MTTDLDELMTIKSRMVLTLERRVRDAHGPDLTRRAELVRQIAALVAELRAVDNRLLGTLYTTWRELLDAEGLQCWSLMAGVPRDMFYAPSVAELVDELT